MLLSAESIDIQCVFAHFVIEDAFSGAQQTGSLGAVPTRCFQRVENQVSLVSCDRLTQREPNECA